MERRIMDFDLFLNESKKNTSKDSKINIVVLIGGGTDVLGIFPEAVDKYCKNQKIKNDILDIDFTDAVFEENKHILVNKNKKIRIKPGSTLIITRSFKSGSTHNKELINSLERNGYFIANDLKAIENCVNKYVTCELLKDLVPIPKYALIKSTDNIGEAVDKIGGKFPIIMKLLTGSKGIGVSIVDSLNSLVSVYQTMKKLDPNAEIMIQEKIESDYDLRIHVLVKDAENCNIIGAMRRNAIGKDFRTNYSLGGSVQKVKLTKEIQDVAIKAAIASGCKWCGVDIMVDKDKGTPYVLEINSSPGIEGISKTIGSPIVKKVIDFLIDKENWNTLNKEK